MKAGGFVFHILQPEMTVVLAQGGFGMHSCSPRLFCSLALASTPSFSSSSSARSSNPVACFQKSLHSPYYELERASHRQFEYGLYVPIALRQFDHISDFGSYQRLSGSDGDGALGSDGFVRRLSDRQSLSSISGGHCLFKSESLGFAGRSECSRSCQRTVFAYTLPLSCGPVLSTPRQRRIALKCLHSSTCNVSSQEGQLSAAMENSKGTHHVTTGTSTLQGSATTARIRWSSREFYSHKGNVTHSSWSSVGKTDGFSRNQEVERRKLRNSEEVDRREEESKDCFEQQERAAAFEQWALHKLKKEGRPALAAIEEMRQTFAPASTSLHSRDLVSEETASDIIGNHTATSELVVSSAEVTSWGTEGNLTKQNFARGSPGWTHGGRPDSIVARSNTWFPKSRADTSSQSERQMTTKAAHQIPTEAFADAETGEKSAQPVPQPLLVKRKTKFPINFHGPFGTVMLVDKPQGWSSFAVCAKLRYLLKIQKVGHAGTLDPMATGLLVVCLGKATKLADSYQAMTKVYSGTLRLGEHTPSLDAFTEVSDVRPWEHITDSDLERAKKDFMGDIFQKPPMYSAVKVQGERLYMKARRGEEIEVAPRIVSVSEFQLRRSSENRQEIHFKVTCSKGTYIRSLCSDLAQAVGCYGHLTVLRREKIGMYSVTDAWPILEFEKHYTEQESESTAEP